MEKQKVSRFEYAIMEIADPEKAKSYLPFSEDEEYQSRKEEVKFQAMSLHSITPPAEDKQ